MKENSNLKYWIEYARREFLTSYGERMASRLEYLATEADVDSGDSPMSADSLRSLIYFLQANPRLKYPDLVLAPSGEIGAEWYGGPNKLFSIDFRPNGDTAYVVRVPNGDNPKKFDRASGVTSRVRLMDIVPPQVQDWTTE